MLFLNVLTPPKKLIGRKLKNDRYLGGKCELGWLIDGWSENVAFHTVKWGSLAISLDEVRDEFRV
jgi:hypothetical protein